jgi:hypothetical protein
VKATTDLVGALERYMATGQTQALGQACESAAADAAKGALGTTAADIPLLALLTTACEYAGEVGWARDAAVRWVETAPLDPYAHYKLALIEQRLQHYPPAVHRLHLAAGLAGPDDDVVNAVRDALTALDAIQMQQVVALREVDLSFRLALRSDPMDALEERGFLLSGSAVRHLMACDDGVVALSTGMPRMLS